MDLRSLLTRRAFWLLVYGGLAVYGIYALWHIPVGVLPRFNYPQIGIIAHDPGATPVQIETLIARPLESQLLSLQDLVTVRSTLSQGTAQITARFAEGTNSQLDLQSVYTAISRTRNQLPSNVQPYAEIMGNANNEVADYSMPLVSGVSPAKLQREIQVRIVPALRALPGVQRVELFGAGHESLWIEPRLTALRHYNVSLSELTKALSQQMLLGPAGYQRMGGQDVFANARHLPSDASQLRQILVPGQDRKVPLDDLAHISRRATPIHHAVTLDGEPALGMVVFKQPNASTIPVTDAVAQKLKQLHEQLPTGAKWVRIYNQGHVVHLIGSDLGRNLLIGGLLAILVLLWILGLHRGVWLLALSIPLSMLLAIAGLYATGHTLNLLTLGALTVAVGLLADDSIIVLESIYHRWEQGEAGVQAVWDGVKDIASPDVSGTLTVVAVYLPLLLVGGLAGLFFVPFALAMSLVLLASLVISLTLIPIGLATLKPYRASQIGSGRRALDWLQHGNQWLLNITLKHPWWSLLASLLLLVLSIFIVLRVPVDFLPLPNEGVLLEGFTLPPGSSLLKTQQAVDKMTRKLQADPAVAHVYARIGSAADTAYTEHSFAGEVQIVLKSNVATSSLDKIASRVLKEGHVQGMQQSIDTPTIERVGESLSGLPQPFVVRVLGDRIDKLRAISDKVTKRLKQIPALSDVFNNDGYPVTQLRIEPKNLPLATYGLTPQQLYQQIQPALNGQVVAQIPQGTYSLDLYVRLADAPNLGLNKLRHLLIRTDTGWTPLGQLATLELVTEPNQLRHIDGQRAIEILATPMGPLGQTVAAAKKAIAGLHLPPGYRVDFGGLLPRLEHAALLTGFAAIGAVLLVLGILMLQFDSFKIVGLILLQIPLTFTGGMFALGISGIGLNATGMIGFLTLIGIGLNHDIVLLHRAQRNQAAGMQPDAAVREAVKVRFRPIVLTTLTAVLGMLPTALGWGLGAAPEQGMALVILGGVVWSSILSTNLIPALYLRISGARP